MRFSHDDSWICGSRLLEETSYSRSYRALDVHTGRLEVVEIVRSNGDLSTTGSELLQAAIGAVDVSHAIEQSYVPKQRQVVLYHDAQLRELSYNDGEEGFDTERHGGDNKGQPNNRDINESASSRWDFRVWSEYISGGTLAERIKQQQQQKVASGQSAEAMPERLKAVRSYAWQLLRGLKQLHECGRPHGSLCASRARFGRRGELRLTGWWHANDASLTSAPTTAFLPPCLSWLSSHALLHNLSVFVDETSSSMDAAESRWMVLFELDLVCLGLLVLDIASRAEPVDWTIAGAIKHEDDSLVVRSIDNPFMEDEKANWERMSAPSQAV